MTVSDPVAQYDTRFNWYAALGAGVWLVFLAPAVLAGWNARETMAGWIGLCALGGFGVLYVWSFLWARPYRHDGRLWRRGRSHGRWPSSAGCSRWARSSSSPSTRTAWPPPSTSRSPAITLLPRRWALPLAGVLALGAEWLARTVPGWQGADGIGSLRAPRGLRRLGHVDRDAPQPRPASPPRRRTPSSWSTRSAPGWPATCTTSSATRSPSSPSRPSWPTGSSTSARNARAPRSPTSNGSPATRSPTSAAPSTECAS